jgi:hypothetical protein
LTLNPFVRRGRVRSILEAEAAACVAEVLQAEIIRSDAFQPKLASPDALQAAQGFLLFALEFLLLALGFFLIPLPLCFDLPLPLPFSLNHSPFGFGGCRYGCGIIGGWLVGLIDPRAAVSAARWATSGRDEYVLAIYKALSSARRLPAALAEGGRGTHNHHSQPEKNSH